MNKPSLRTAIESGNIVVAPGIHDMIAAVVSNHVGFDFVYSSGYWGTASAEGIPDAGITTYTEMLGRVETLCRTANASVIADADTGYGGLLNVDHTVRGYERAGAVAIQIEDQEIPKKCGHTPNKRLVSRSEMALKVKVASAARENKSETLIIARTDARQSEGFESAIQRGLAYRDAGADIVFIEALESEEEMRRACELIPAPMMANMADGGVTPIRPAEELAQMGYNLAVFPAMTGLAAAAAVEKALGVLKTKGTSASADLDLFDFQQFNQLIGFQKVWDFEAKWTEDN